MEDKEQQKELSPLAKSFLAMDLAIKKYSQGSVAIRLCLEAWIQKNIHLPIVGKN